MCIEISKTLNFNSSNNKNKKKKIRGSEWRKLDFLPHDEGEKCEEAQGRTVFMSFILFVLDGATTEVTLGSRYDEHEECKNHYHSHEY